MKRRFVRAVLAVIAAAGALSAASAAQAQEIQLTGPAQGRAGGAPPAPLPRGAVRARADGVVHAARRVPAHDPLRRAAQLQHHRLDRDRRLGRVRRHQLEHEPGRPRSTRTGARATRSRPSTSTTTATTSSTRTAIGDAPFTDQTAKLNWRGRAAAHVHPVPRQARHLQQDLRRHRLLPGRRRRASSGSRSAATAAAGGEQLACSDPRVLRAHVARRRSRRTFGVGFTFYPGNFVLARRRVPRPALLLEPRRASTRAARAPNGNFPDGQINSQDETFKFNQMITVSVGLLAADEAEDQRVDGAAVSGLDPDIDHVGVGTEGASQRPLRTSLDP